MFDSIRTLPVHGSAPVRLSASEGDSSPAPTWAFASAKDVDAAIRSSRTSRPAIRPGKRNLAHKHGTRRWSR